MANADCPWMATPSTPTDFTFASLFSGCGGFDLGFVQAGFRCVAALDHDAAALAVHEKNFCARTVVCDLSNSVPMDLLRNVDVLLAGPPCQGFSTAGKRQLNDPRNALLLVAGQIAAKLRPKVVVVENVAGVKAGAHRQYWDALREGFRQAAYRTVELSCLGTTMGVPQIRRRNVMIAWQAERDIKVLLPERPGGVLSNALDGVESASNHDIRLLDRGSQMALIAKRIKPGQKLSNVRAGLAAVHTWDIPEVFGNTSSIERDLLEYLLRVRRRNRIRENGDADPVPLSMLVQGLGPGVCSVVEILIGKGYIRRASGSFDLAHAFNGKFRRLCWQKPSLTVDTRFGDPRYFLHPEENRGFTVREAARIQGFPDKFVFTGPTPVQYRLIGNAVPPPMANSIAEFVRDAILR